MCSLAYSTPRAPESPRHPRRGGAGLFTSGIGFPHGRATTYRLISVRSLINDKGNTIKPGDVYLSNNPYNGGTHLPDVTAITPVFLGSGESTAPPTAVRAGGPRPYVSTFLGSTDVMVTFVTDRSQPTFSIAPNARRVAF